MKRFIFIFAFILILAGNIVMASVESDFLGLLNNEREEAGKPRVFLIRTRITSKLT